MLCGGSAVAQQPGPGCAPAPTPPGCDGAAFRRRPGDRIPLSLQEAVALGIENNIDVELLRFDPLIADYDADGGMGRLRPAPLRRVRLHQHELPVASTFFPEQFVERTSEGEAGLAGLVPKLGWSYEIALRRPGRQTNSLIQTLGPTYTTEPHGQPGRAAPQGRLWGEPWTQVKLTGIGTGSALEQFRLRLMDIVRSIEDGYWNLAATRQELEVANKSLETALTLLDQTKAQYDVGVVSRVEVVEAEAGVADREFRQIRARERSTARRRTS